MPYYLRFILHLPRGPLSARRVSRRLEPRSGERILEVGAGVGSYALPIARSFLPEGRLHALDIQRNMLDALVRGAARSGLGNVVPARGDARNLPYADHAFDAVVLITALGEIPDSVAALREIRRVLAPGGRLLIGELAMDPDFIPVGALRAMAPRAGLALEGVVGPGIAYCALLRPAHSSLRSTADELVPKAAPWRGWRLRVSLGGP